MRVRVSRAALGIVLFLVAVLPYPPALGQPPTLPPPCKELVFSTEEEFVTQGPEPADGNPILSDGDLLGVATLPSGDVTCILCARNADLLGQTFDVAVDLGLDAVDVIDPEQFLIAFSTELDSPNLGQFTEGDLLVTNGAIIPNRALTYKWQVPYDLALDAVHLVGKLEGIRAFLDAAAKLGRVDWLEDALTAPGTATLVTQTLDYPLGHVRRDGEALAAPDADRIDADDLTLEIDQRST